MSSIITNGNYATCKSAGHVKQAKSEKQVMIGGGNWGGTRLLNNSRYK